MPHRIFYIMLLLTSFSLMACDRNNNFNLIDPQEDVVLGQQLRDEVLSNPGQFQVLDPQQHPESYAYLQSLLNTIIEGGEVAYKDEFAWQIYIIKDDQTINAFAAPGGYIFVYTGLIKYLDSDGELAGVLGHEIAHADLRHASRQLQKAHGLNLVLNMLTGGEDSSLAGEIVAQLAGQLAGLSFSREYEEEADARSVDYLSETPFPCNAGGSFFQKLEQEEEQGNLPTFLSTHPHPQNRVKKIEQRSRRMGCYSNDMPNSNYQQLKESLP